MNNLKPMLLKSVCSCLNANLLAFTLSYKVSRSGATVQQSVHPLPIWLITGHSAGNAVAWWGSWCIAVVVEIACSLGDGRLLSHLQYTEVML